MPKAWYTLVAWVFVHCRRLSRLVSAKRGQTRKKASIRASASFLAYFLETVMPIYSPYRDDTQQNPGPGRNSSVLWQIPTGINSPLMLTLALLGLYRNLKALTINPPLTLHGEGSKLLDFEVLA